MPSFFHGFHFHTNINESKKYYSPQEILQLVKYSEKTILTEYILYQVIKNFIKYNYL
jgi:hypothetical protein